MPVARAPSKVSPRERFGFAYERYSFVQQAGQEFTKKWVSMAHCNWYDTPERRNQAMRDFIENHASRLPELYRNVHPIERNE